VQWFKKLGKVQLESDFLDMLAQSLLFNFKVKTQKPVHLFITAKHYSDILSMKIIG
jgi:hypothetical protein